MPELTQKTLGAALIAFHKMNPKAALMIRPDRPTDLEAHRYSSEDERRAGQEARAKWGAYLAARGFKKTLKFWRDQLDAGRSVMVVCADPMLFDLAYVPPATMPRPRADQKAPPLTHEDRERIARDIRRVMSGKVPSPRDRQPFDPSAETFSPYWLQMTVEEITQRRADYRAGRDWSAGMPEGSFIRPASRAIETDADLPEYIE